MTNKWERGLERGLERGFERTLERKQGKSLFAVDADVYDRARPDYPEELYLSVEERVGGFAGTNILEIGPGNGLATKRIAKTPAGKLTLLEPDKRFESKLEALKASTLMSVELIYETFENFQHGSGDFDLVLAATCFHWLAPETRLQKIADLLKPGGFVILLWNVFGDAGQPDLFHDATQRLFAPVPVSPSNENDKLPFALDVDARKQEFSATECFEEPIVAKCHWPLVLTTAQMRELYSTFSGINALPTAERQILLAGLESVANEQFQGQVVRNMTSIVYVAKRLSTAD